MGLRPRNARVQLRYNYSVRWSVRFMSGSCCFLFSLSMLLFLQLLNIWYSHRSSARFEYRVHTHQFTEAQPRLAPRALFSLGPAVLRRWWLHYFTWFFSLDLNDSSVNSERRVFANFQPGVVLTKSKCSCCLKWKSYGKKKTMLRWKLCWHSLDRQGMSWADKTIIRAMYIPLMWCRYSQYALLSTSDKDH